MGLNTKNLSSGFVNNKGADRPAAPLSLISAFVIPLMNRIISKLARSEIAIFYVVSVTKQTGLL